MGVCKYTLTKTTKETPCAFNIMVSNERRNNKKKVSYTKQVDVEIGGSYIVLFKGRKTEVRAFVQTGMMTHRYMYSNVTRTAEGTPNLIQPILVEGEWYRG